jgi:hypothetical protein
MKLSRSNAFKSGHRNEGIGVFTPGAQDLQARPLARAFDTAIVSYELVVMTSAVPGRSQAKTSRSLERPFLRGEVPFEIVPGLLATRKLSVRPPV